ncbi:MAG TPA: glycosyltransferase 87 family protein, partial [Capillimicrobium sp.]|nr:glycosyltransferase 87 family protein [Capillimicrobium sp.]
MRAAAPALALIAIYAVATTVGPTSDTTVNDLYVYSVYADLLRDGQLPFADFGFEYPPLAIAPIALGGGAWPLAVAMLACLLVAQWCCGRLAGPAAAWVVAISPLLTGAMVRTHFDALPAALAIGALLAFARERPRLGFALLAVGGMVKAWPLVLVPVAAAWLLGRGRRRAAWQGVALAAAICALVLVPVALLPGGADGLADAVRFHQDRPVQIESTPASVLFAVGDSYVTGHPVR